MQCELHSGVVGTDIDILREQLLPIADDFSGQLTFAISDEDEFEDELKSLGLDDWGEDVAIAIWVSARVKYRMSEEYDSDSLREFIQVGNSCMHPHFCQNLLGNIILIFRITSLVL